MTLKRTKELLEACNSSLGSSYSALNIHDAAIDVLGSCPDRPENHAAYHGSNLIMQQTLRLSTIELAKVFDKVDDTNSLNALTKNVQDYRDLHSKEAARLLHNNLYICDECNRRSLEDLKDQDEPTPVRVFDDCTRFSISQTDADKKIALWEENVVKLKGMAQVHSLMTFRHKVAAHSTADRESKLLIKQIRELINATSKVISEGALLFLSYQLNIDLFRESSKEHADEFWWAFVRGLTPPPVTPP